MGAEFKGTSLRAGRDLEIRESPHGIPGLLQVTGSGVSGWLGTGLGAEERRQRSACDHFPFPSTCPHLAYEGHVYLEKALPSMDGEENKRAT